MKNWIFTILLSAAGLAAAAETPAQPVYTKQLSGDIVIDVEGNVRNYELKDADLTPQLREIVDRSIRHWRFEPVVVDGKPVNAKTSMRLQIEAKPIAEGYAIKVDSIVFGSPTRDQSKLKPPRYPWVAQQGGVEALVVLVLRLDAEGRVTDLYPEQTSLSGSGPEKIVQQWRRMFEDNAMEAARRWRFEIKETVDGRPVADSAVRIPVEYRLGKANGWTTALIPTGGPSRIPAWGRVWQPAATPAALRQGESLSLTSAFKLKNSPVGSYL